MAPLLAANEALKVTLVSLAIWVVLFPVLVQGLIAYAVVQVRGEKRQNEENRRRRA
jgi:heme/copper-type cytochrome/quinol oxidase subunit 2